jgi:O-antigen ligase
MLYPLLMLAFKKVKHYKLIYLLCIILLLNLVLTFTRGSWLAFMVGLFIFIMLYRWKLVVLAAAVMPLGLFIPGVSGRLASIFDTNSWTIVERFRLWKTGYLMFKDHPIIGVGNGNYLSRYNEYIKRYPELDIGWEKFSVHNSYLKVLSETGILGFAPFILVVFFFVKEIIHIWKNGRNDISKNIALAFLCSIASYLFQNISNNLFFIPQVNALYWIIGGIIIAYNNIGTHKDNLNNL